MPVDKKAKAASNARLTYLANREKLIQGKVDKLGLILFDRINENFLNSLELSDDGKLINNGKNIRQITALNAIYANFNKEYNVPVIQSFFNDLGAIGSLNEKYFDAVTKKQTKASRYKSEKIVNKQLGLTSKGELIKNGFADKFIKSNEVITTIKKKTLEAIVKGKGFQELRQELQETVQGTKGKEFSGVLHQYYRNNAYDTLTKVDRLYSDTMAKDLSLVYFFYSGGIINTTRPFCRECNGKIINGNKFNDLTFQSLKLKYQSGIPDGKHAVWDPLIDLGGYGCRHTKDYILTEVALNLPAQILNLNILMAA